MGQTVGEIMTVRPICLSVGDSVRDAARLMREKNVGAILVTENDRLYGIVTDRDLVVRGLALGGDVETTPLSDICTRDPVTLRPDDEVDTAVNLMRERAIRRIPVAKYGRVFGIVSLGDLALERDPTSVLGRVSLASPNNSLASPNHVGAAANDAPGSRTSTIGPRRVYSTRRELPGLTGSDSAG